MEAVVMSDVILLFVNLRDEECSLQNLIEYKLKFLVSKFELFSLPLQYCQSPSHKNCTERPVSYSGRVFHKIVLLSVTVVLCFLNPVLTPKHSFKCPVGDLS
jgi:hypothetical protein